MNHPSGARGSLRFTVALGRALFAAVSRPARGGHVVRLAVLAAVMGLAQGPLPTARGATYYWDTNGTTAGFGTAGGTWGTDAFWNTDSSGGAGTFATNTDWRDALNFGTAGAGLGAGTVSVSASQGFSSLTFGSASGGITLDGGTLSMDAASGGTVTVNSATATIGSQVQGTATTLTKNGSGTLILAAPNYAAVASTNTAAGTTISAGTLQLNHALAVRDSQVTVSAANGLAFGTGIGTFMVGGLVGSSNFALTDTGSTAVTLQVGSINVATSYSGVMSGSGGNLVKVGTANQDIGGANTFTGTTTISGGTLSLANNGTLASTSGVTVSPGATLSLDFNIDRNRINDAAGLALAGGTVALTNGATTEAVASTTLNAGATTLSRASGTSVLRLNAIIRNVGGTINFGVASMADTDTSNSANILGGWAVLNNADWAVSGSSAANTAVTALGAGSYTTQNNPASWAANQHITNSGAYSGTVGSNVIIATLRFNNASAGTVTIGGSVTLTIANGGILATSTVGNNLQTITGGTLRGASGTDLVIHQANTSNGLTIASVIANNTTATALTKSGTGLLTLTGANTYTGATYVNAGTINLGVAETAGTSGPLGNSAASNPGSIVLTGGTLQYSASNTNDYSGRFSTAANQRYNADTNAQSVTWATALTSSGGSLTKSGTGTLTLGGSDANTFTGPATVSGGTLALNKTAGVNAVGGNVTIGSGATLLNSEANQIPDTADISVAGTWSLNGKNETVDLLTGAGTVSLGAGTLTLGADNGNGTFSGGLSGSGALVKTGTGTQRLEGGNLSYTGQITINDGVLHAATNVNSLGGTAVGTVVNAGGSLYLQGSVTFPSKALTLSGMGFANTGALRNVSGNNTWAGPITLGSSGVLVYNDDGTLTLNNTSAITGSNTNVTFDGPSNAATSTLVGGAMAIGSGAVTIAGGTVGLGSNGTTGSLNTSSSITVNSPGVLQFNRTNTIAQGTDFPAGIAGTGSVTQANTNTNSVAVLSGTNTYTGTTTVSGNVLRITAATALGGGFLDLGSATAGGGVLELDGVGSFTRPLRTSGSGNVRVGNNNSAGFSARTSAVAVAFAGAPSPLVWGGTSGFNPDRLMLNDDNATSTIDFQHGINLNGSSRTVRVDAAPANATAATISGVIGNTTGTAGLFKQGRGLLILGASGTYNGETWVSGGVLRANDGTTLPNGNLVIVGGALEGSVDITRSRGTTSGTVRVESASTASGFSAYGGAVRVAIGGLASPSALTWAGTGSNFSPGPLLLNAATADNTIDFRNSIDLNNGNRFVQVDGSPTAATAATMSGILSGFGGSGLTKTGTGLLILSATNTYSAATTINSGVLRATEGVGLPTNGNLNIVSSTGLTSVLETGANLARAAGTGTSQMQISTGTGTAGFSANGGAVQVAFGTIASPTALTWGSGQFLPGTLLLNATTANNTIDFKNAINLNGAARTVQVDAAAADATAATMSGILSGTGSSGLVKAGSGLLKLTAVNTYAGATTVNAGTLVVTSTGTINSTSGVNVGAGGTFRYDNATTALSKPLSFAGTGGTIGGTGRIGVDLTITSGNTLSPGASPGTLSQTGNQTWATDGNYNWQMLDATAAAGTGFDLMSITGSLTIQSGFNVNLWSLSATGPDVNGNAINFDADASAYWVIATASAGLVNPGNLASANLFTTSRNGTGGFTNVLLDGATFSLVQGGSLAGTTANDVVLVYIPEPSACCIALAGLTLAGFAMRRRLRRPAPKRLA